MTDSWIGCLFLGMILQQDLIEERTTYRPPVNHPNATFLEWAAGHEIVIEGKLPDQVKAIALDPKANPWTVLQKAAQAAGGHWRLSGQSVHFVRGPGGPVEFASPFWRASIDSIQAERSFDIADGKLLIRLDAAWHPRLGPILVQGGVFTLEYEIPAGDLKKVGEDKQNLNQNENGGKRKIATRPTSWIPIDQKFHASLDLSANAIPRSVQKIDRLTGEIRLVAPQRLAWIALGAIEEPASGAREQKVGKTLIRRVGQKIAPNRISLEVEIKPGPSAFYLESYQENALIGPAKITLPSGDEAVWADGYTTVQNDNGWMRIRYDWLRKDQRNLKELVRGVVEVRLGDHFKELVAEVAFRDLPLP